MTTQETELMIREFEPGDEAAFRQLNEAWIVRHFAMEPKDEASLSDPQGTILGRGGRIFFAVRDGRAVGCCALLPMGRGEYELAKMAVAESARRGGIGRRILERIIAEVQASAGRRVYLETSNKLAPAIRLYESLGFRHLPPERVVPSAYARANVYMELFLDPDGASRTVAGR
jgi:putative acetyltransferase